MYDKREVYPNPPLAIVIAELRYPYSPRLKKQEVLDELLLKLEDLLPVLKPAQQATVKFDPGVTPEPPVIENVFRIFDTTSTLSASIRPTALAVETTGYIDFESFMDRISRVVSAMKELGAASMIERAGLRFIDEIRVPKPINMLDDWSEWVDPRLLSTASMLTDGISRGMESIVRYRTLAGNSLHFRCAAIDGPPIVGNDPLKRRSVPKEGPYFVIDIDSFWEASDGNYEKFDVEVVRSLLSDLHGPTGALFQACITDRARELFRQEG